MVRARASHARGRRFEPCRIHQNTPLRHCRFGVFFITLFRQGERVGAALREQSVFAPLHFAYAFFGRKQTIDYRLAGRAATGASPVESTKTPRFGIAVAGRFFIALFRQGERVGAALREQSVFAPLHFAYAFFGRKQTIDYRLAGRAATGASPVESTKTPRFGIAVAGCFFVALFDKFYAI